MSAPRETANPSGLCGCGCGGVTPLAKKTRSKKGYRKGEHLLFIAGHVGWRPRPGLETLYEIDGNGCWVFRGCRDHAGYGRINRNGLKTRAHRFFYLTLVGPVPDGLELDHLCRNRACVNPEHLEPVTHTENVRRSAKLNPERVLEIRASSERTVDLAARFGVSKTAISEVRRGLKWRDIERPADWRPLLELFNDRKDAA